MKQDNTSTENAAEERAIKAAEGQLVLPSAPNMQLLESTLPGPDFRTPGDIFSATAMVSQAAAAAPASFGKYEVGQAAVLAGLGDKALVNSPDEAYPVDSEVLLKPLTGLDANEMDLLGQLNNFVTELDAKDGPTPGDALVSLMANLDSAPDPDNLTAAIQSVADQIGLLNEIFMPILDGLNADVQSEKTFLNTLPTPDLGLSIVDDAGELSTSLTDLLGTVDIISSPQIDSLLSLDSTFEEIVSLVGSLPELDLTSITDPVIDVIGEITEPVVDAVLEVIEPLIETIDSAIEPVVDTLVELTEPVLDVLSETTDQLVAAVVEVTEPLIDTVSTVLEPVIEPLTDLTEPVVETLVETTEPILDTIEDLSEPLLETVSEIGLLSGLTSSSSTNDEAGLLDTLSSGISSTAGADDSSLSGLLGALDPTK